MKAKSKTPPPSKNEAREKYNDYNPLPLNPLLAQEKFKPTDAEPVGLHKKMAGC